MAQQSITDDLIAEHIEPRPAALIETFRAIGYTLPTAIADIMDNSISSEAKNIWVDFHWKQAESSMTIRDDGHGMSLEQIIEALRPGASPLQERGAKDLGRFGLGLKTASFSQCRRMTVLSKTKAAQVIHHRGWDLDLVERKKQWLIHSFLSDQGYKAPLQSQSQGTIIVWEELDRIIFSQNKSIISHAKFLELIREVEAHLSMVFHRFIEKKKLNIYINDNLIEAWNPFLPDEAATQSFPSERYQENQVTITGYVLPHASKLSAAKWDQAAGTRGWTALQGFYIYRRDRILLAGDWLGLFRKEDCTKLARIMVEIDSRMDFSWQIDIRKSRALPPKMFQEELRRYAQQIRVNAIDVYRHRGKQQQRSGSESGISMGWLATAYNGREYFKINRKHPLIAHALSNPTLAKTELEKIFKMLEMTLPIPAIVLNESLYADNPSTGHFPIKEEEMTQLIKTTYKHLRSSNTGHADALQELHFIEPFAQYPHLIEQIDEHEKN